MNVQAEASKKLCIEKAPGQDFCTGACFTIL